MVNAHKTQIANNGKDEKFLVPLPVNSPISTGQQPTTEIKYQDFTEPTASESLKFNAVRDMLTHYPAQPSTND